MSVAVLYEPRSLWSIANAKLAAGNASPTIYRLNRRHLTNLTRWPMTLTRVVLGAVNYTFDELLLTTAAQSQQPQFWLQASDIIQQVQCKFSAPFRYNINAKGPINTATLTPRPTWEPPQPTAILGVETFSFFSGYLGTSQLKFKEPMVIPRNGALEWQLSAFTPVVFGTSPEDEAPGTNGPMFATMLYQERGGMFFGNSRIHQFQPNPFVTPLDTFADPSEKWPYSPDLASNAGTYTALPGTTNWWDPKAMFTAAKFRAQGSTRQGSCQLTDMRTMINQFAYDGDVATAFNNAFGYIPTQKLTPMCMRMGTRVKTVGCGTEAWWWRPGAPLGLVFDDITPALVYDLPEQITLQPGDTLDAELIFPPNTAIFDDTSVTVPAHVGVSFNGYATIEG